MEGRVVGVCVGVYSRCSVNTGSPHLGPLHSVFFAIPSWKDELENDHWVPGQEEVRSS